ncbi:MAG: hypothetical protein ACYSN7_00090, partial [Planctomycetota bacterium]
FPAGRPGWSLATTVALPCSDFPPDVLQSGDRLTHSMGILSKQLPHGKKYPFVLQVISFRNNEKIKYHPAFI